jgi:A/G-specific adenine glycosylase
MVSEFMLQQTQVATVLPYYGRWLRRFPNFRSLAEASTGEVLHAWQGLGYYARARNLHAAARAVVEKLGGRLPADGAALRQLPGVGRYTAGAIASFAFGLPEPLVDANVARALARLTNCQIPIDTSAGREHLWETATLLLPEINGREFNSALMELGALVCLPQRPRCGACPVRSHCAADDPGRLPLKKPPPPLVEVVERHGFVRSRHRVLMEQARARWRGMWILPPLSRTTGRSPLLRLQFPFTHHRVTLAVFAARGPLAPNDQQRWFPLPALENIPIPTPHRRALDQLLAAESES